MIRRRMSLTVQYAILIVASIISAFPLYYMVVSMFNNSVQIVSGRLMPSSYFMENMNKLLNETSFVPAFFNSVKYTIVGTVISVAVCAIAGYGFEIYHDKAKDRTMNILLLSMMVPGAVTLVPMFNMYAKLGLLSSTLGYVLPFFSTALLIMLFRQCARSFPKELVDAARIDGLGEINIFLRIFVPVMKASFACGIIICVMSIWNDYLWGLVIIRAPNMQTLQMFLASLNDGYTIDYGLMMCAVTMSTLPLALVFFFLQKAFVESITGSVK